MEYGTNSNLIVTNLKIAEFLSLYNSHLAQSSPQTNNIFDFYLSEVHHHVFIWTCKLCSFYRPSSLASINSFLNVPSPTLSESVPEVNNSLVEEVLTACAFSVCPFLGKLDGFIRSQLELRRWTR